MKSIYLLAKCNDLKEYSSFETLIVTTSKRELVKELKKQIEAGVVSVGNENLYEYLIHGDISPCLFAKELNDILQNVYLQIWND